MRSAIKQFLKSKSGTTAIEYALIAVLLSLAVMGGFSSTGNGLGALWERNGVRLQEGLNQNN